MAADSNATKYLYRNTAKYDKISSKKWALMQTISLMVDDSFMRDKKVEITDDDFPQDLAVSSVEEARRRIFDTRAIRYANE